MTNQKDTYARVKLETESDAQTYKEFVKQIEKERVDSKEKIIKLTKDMKFLASRIKDNNRFLKEHKLDVVEFTPVIKKGKKIQSATPAPQTP
jgi:hypothetical protein